MRVHKLNAMKKISLLTVMVFAIFSCKNANESSHTEMINRIDKLDLSEKIYEVAIRDDGSKGDTVSVKYLKKDADGKTLYEKVDRFKSGWHSEVYYNENEDEFFRKSKNNRNVITTQEHFYVNDSLMQKTIVITSDEADVDTSIINYEYAYNSNGKARQMEFAMDGDMYITKFNGTGQRTAGLQVQNEDTISQFETVFKDGKIVKSIYKFRNRNQVDYFDDKKNRIKSEVYTIKGDSMVLARELIYTYDEDGNMLSKTISHPEWNSTNRTEYFRVDV